MEPATCPWKDFYVPKSNQWDVDKLNQNDKKFNLLFDDKLPEIYSIISEADNEVFESESFQVEQCRGNSDLGQLNSLEISEVSLPMMSSKREDSSFLSAVEAVRLQHSEEGLDIRPYLFDSNTKQHILWDSGSQVTAWPPEPGDKVDPKLTLRAVNGS